MSSNAQKIIRNIEAAKSAGASIVAFPEMAITGYPPEDLLFKAGFIEDNLRALRKIIPKTKGICAIVGFVDKKEDIYNAAAIMADGKLADVYHKMYLPNYGVFDEFRYFRPGDRAPVYRINGSMVGVSICEDIWYPEGPSRTQALLGAELLININASPFSAGKESVRERMLIGRARDSAAVIAYLNTVGGQDELVFDGASMIINQSGEAVRRGARFKEDLVIEDVDLGAVFSKRLQDPRLRQQAIEKSGAGSSVIDIKIKTPAKRRLPKPASKPAPYKPLSLEEEVFEALKLGLRDYIHKQGFNKQGVLIALSGGVDSAFVAAIAADALGADKVLGVFMPSRYTSNVSKEDALELCKNLRIKLLELPIDSLFKGFLDSLGGPFRGLPANATEENIQARIRGTLMMALSNKTGRLVLTTGNKSEMSVGYATLYGDMAGGFAVIKDVPKTLVYSICMMRNKKSSGPVIPSRVLAKAPTAELRPNQKDTDSLPPYDVLDPILKAYIEEERSIADIAEITGSPESLVREVVNMVDKSEYKRRQSPPGIKITSRAFGRDWRLPITNRYKGGE